MVYHCPSLYLTVVPPGSQEDYSNRIYLTLLGASLGRTLFQVVQAQMLSSWHFPWVGFVHLNESNLLFWSFSMVLCLECSHLCSLVVMSPF